MAAGSESDFGRRENEAVNSTADCSLSERIAAVLPQTQCTRCAYSDCAAYAQAIASGEASINQCPPGGAEGVERLSRITGLPVQPLNPAHGIEAPRAVAIIDEAWCIGCTLCIKACPVDAIVGSNRLMHTVIESHCTGCELCVPVCPVDCISLEAVTGMRTGWAAWSGEQAEASRTRYFFHSKQRSPEKRTSAEMPAPAAQPAKQADATGRKRSMIEAALARARAHRENSA